MVLFWSFFFYHRKFSHKSTSKITFIYNTTMYIRCTVTWLNLTVHLHWVHWTINIYSTFGDNIVVPVFMPWCDLEAFVVVSCKFYMKHNAFYTSFHCWAYHKGISAMKRYGGHSQISYWNVNNTWLTLH